MKIKNEVTTGYMSNREHWLWRIGFAFIAGLIVVAVALNQVPDRDAYLWRVQYVTVKSLQQSNRDIDIFRARHHRLPKSLGEVPEESDDGFNPYGSHTDGWGRPLIYRVRGGKCYLASYGRDEIPGGSGLDRDLFPNSSVDDLSRATSLQLVFHPFSEGVRYAAATCGVITFLLTLALLHARNFVGPGLIVLISKLLAILTCASLVAIVLAFLHIPEVGGH